jgi:Flp pilus assembly protein TadD
VKEKDDKIDEAIVEIKRALEVKKDSVDLLGFLASLYREKKDNETALQILHKTVEIEPKNDKLWFSLGAIYDENKQKEEAIAAMQKAIDLNPNNAAALNYLGYTFAEMGVELDKAERLIRQAMAIEPNDGFYLDSLAWVYYQRGDFKQAAEHLEHAVELAGEDPTITEHLADAYEKLGRRADALRIYRDALARSKEPDQVERLKRKIGVVEQRLTGA